MALYVAVCLLAALTAIAEQADAGHVDVFKRPGTPVVRR
jgi:hypothetical protein